MTKGRNSLPPATEVGPTYVTKTPDDLAKHPVMSPEVRALMEDVYALGQDFGDLRTATFYEMISDSVKLAAYERAKESKAYRFLVNPQTGNHFTSLEEFCEVKLGVGYRRMQQLSGNKNLLGQEAFEQGQRLGLRQVDYNAIRALPAPKQEIIRQAADEATSREDLTRLIRELAAQDQAEIGALSKEIADLKADLTAKDKVLAADRKRIDMLASEVERVKSEPADERIAALRKDLAGVGFEIEALLLNKFLPVLQEINDHERAHGGDSAGPMLGAVRQVERTMAAVRAECGMPALQDDDLARV